MSRTRPAGACARRAAHAASAALAAAVALAGCADRPDPLGRTNPFDPNNPQTGGDPFRLRATVRGVAVDLEWDAVALPPLRADARRAGAPSCPPSYAVYRASTLVGLAERPDRLAAELGATAFRDTTPLADGTSYYVVAFMNIECRESLRSAALAVRVDLAPLLEIRAAACDTCAAASTESRRVRLFVRAQDADSILVSNAASGDTLIAPTAFAAAAGGIDWTLSPSASNDDTIKVVFARAVRGDGSTSAVVSDSVTVEPLAVHLLVDSLPQGPVLTGRRTVSVALQRSATDRRAPAGADSMEVAFDLPFPGTWVPFADAFSVPLPSPALDTLRVRVKNDFGIETAKSMAVRPDSLLDARIVLGTTRRLNLPEPGTTPRCRVNVHVDAGRATAICLSNAPPPPCTTFEPTAGTRLDWPLEGPAGRGVLVYAILANEWRPEGGAVVSDSIFIEDRAATVWITRPTRLLDSTYTVGDSALVQGNGTRAACGPAIRSVLLSAGGAAVGEATLATPAPGDTADVVWSVPWRVDGSGETARLTALLTDEAGNVAADSIDVSIQPRSAARRAATGRR
jgi:hypothetical protein